MDWKGDEFDLCEDSLSIRLTIYDIRYLLQFPQDVPASISNSSLLTANGR